MKMLIISLMLVATSQTLTAQESTPAAQESIPAPSKIPLAAMQKLAPMTGSWSMVMEYSPDDGATWQEGPTSQVNSSYQLKNLILSEEPTDAVASTFQTATLFSYDQYRNTYRIAVVDDTWGLMDIYEGTIENGVLVATNLRAGTTFPIDNKISRAFRLKIKFLSTTQRTMEIDKSDDGGKSWQPNFNLVYTKN